MKKLFIVLAVATLGFVACNNDSEKSTTTDSTATVVDSTANAATEVIDSTASAAKDAVDSTAKAAIDTLKKKN